MSEHRDLMLEPADIGHGVSIETYVWEDSGPVAGVIVNHPHGHCDACGRPEATKPGEKCVGSVIFDTPENRQRMPGHKAFWTVESLEPLTLSPSIRCGCGHHGWIQNGKWVPAS